MNSTGIFALHFFDIKHGIAVGRNYRAPNQTQNNALYTNNGGKTWQIASQQVLGYRSGIGKAEKIWFSTGTNGTHISNNRGKNWQAFLTEGFNTISYIPSTHELILTDNKGQIGIYNLSLIIKNHSK